MKIGTLVGLAFGALVLSTLRRRSVAKPPRARTYTVARMENTTRLLLNYLHERAKAEPVIYYIVHKAWQRVLHETDCGCVMLTSLEVSANNHVVGQVLIAERERGTARKPQYEAKCTVASHLRRLAGAPSGGVFSTAEITIDAVGIAVADWAMDLVRYVK